MAYKIRADGEGEKVSQIIFLLYQPEGGLETAGKPINQRGSIRDLEK